MDIRKNGHEFICRFVAADVNQDLEFDLRNVEPSKEGGWQNYVLGVVSELQKLGGKFSGFDCHFKGNVPIGSGMSSSAALECSLAYGLNELFGLGYSKFQLIKASQMAEHNFVGIKCGIMDQFASVMGKMGHVIKLDCRSLEYEYFPLDLGDHQLLLLNTNISHQLASSEYNKRRAECEAGAAIIRKSNPEVMKLRDVTRDMLEAASNEMTATVYRRCKHVIDENRRVEEATQAMLSGNHEELGRLIYDSHDSLSKLYAVSCEELDFLVDCTRDKHYVLGSRMMGGGFGGCTINLLRKENVNEFKEEICARYKDEFGIDLSIYEVMIADGSRLVNEN